MMAGLWRMGKICMISTGDTGYGETFSATEMFAPFRPGPAQRQLIGYWQSRRAGDGMPHWRDVDPLDIPHLLAHIWISELSGEGQAVPVYRLAGTEICRLHGGELRGRKVQEALNRPYAPFLARVLQDAFKGTAAAIRVQDVDRHPDYDSYECVLLPVHRGEGLNVIGLTTFARKIENRSLTFRRSWDIRVLQHDTATGDEWWLDTEGGKTSVAPL